MNTVIVFTQNFKIESFPTIIKKDQNEKFIFVTTHFLFENERNAISLIYDNCEFYTFADFLSEKEMEICDKKAFSSSKMEYDCYIKRIKKRKNSIVAKKVVSLFLPGRRIILSDDLGIDISVWQKQGFELLTGEYYYIETKKKNNLLQVIKNQIRHVSFLKKLYHLVFKNKHLYSYNANEVSKCVFNGRKYVFIGNLNRIGYRFTVDFVHSPKDADNLSKGIFEDKTSCTYLTTWHERWKCHIPDCKKYEVRWAQDGYLPPNYSHKDYFFKPNNVKYYCWDYLGTMLFKNQGLPYEMIPFRKKIYLQMPKFPEKVKNVLVVASGSGDWTALKNRSDDDLLVDAFVRLARKYPDIKFVYRCHPTWVHPLNVGVNSINRVAKCFAELNLKNIVVSCNIPSATQDNKNYSFSFSRSSLDEDLANADMVFGEHSISMIDAAMKRLPFSSVNLTKRRNFFVGITELGFPHCSSISDIEQLLEKISTQQFQSNYKKAISRYNEMTDMLL